MRPLLFPPSTLFPCFSLSPAWICLDPRALTLRDSFLPLPPTLGSVPHSPPACSETAPPPYSSALWPWQATCVSPALLPPLASVLSSPFQAAGVSQRKHSCPRFLCPSWPPLLPPSKALQSSGLLCTLRDLLPETHPSPFPLRTFHLFPLPPPADSSCPKVRQPPWNHGGVKTQPFLSCTPLFLWSSLWSACSVPLPCSCMLRMQ